ncbi:MAG: hypothetical protein IEMM0008_1321 [bacterium]|nr:MAG: hypothetical protein IEMM0008_1321 [bacterium]
MKIIQYSAFFFLLAGLAFPMGKSPHYAVGQRIPSYQIYASKTQTPPWFPYESKIIKSDGVTYLYMKGLGEGRSRENAIKEAQNDAINKLSEMIYLYAQSMSYEFIEGSSDDFEQVRKIAISLDQPGSQMVKVVRNRARRIDQWTSPIYRVYYINDDWQPELGDQIEYIAYVWTQIPYSTIISLRKRYKKLVRHSSSKAKEFSSFGYGITEDQDLEIIKDGRITYAPGQKIPLSPKQKAPSWTKKESIRLTVHGESYMCFVGQGDAKTFKKALEQAKRDAQTKIVESLGFFVSSKSADAWLEDEKGIDNILMEQFAIKSAKHDVSAFMPIYSYTEHFGVVKDTEGGDLTLHEPLIRGYILLGIPNKTFQRLLKKL